jgi:hypothetical protein
MTNYHIPRSIDLVLSHRIVEALRDATIAHLYADMPAVRQGDDTRRADVLQTAIHTLQKLDIDAVLGELRTNLAPDEDEAFEAAAKTNSFNVQKVGGQFLHPITKRAHALWRAAVRWQQLHQATTNPPARRADDQQGENQ